MKELETRIRDALGKFYSDSLCLEKLAAMAVNIAEDDPDYVPGCLLAQMSLGDGYKSLKNYIREYFEVEDTLQETDDENNQIFRALPDTAAFVLSNVAITPLAIEAYPPVFQDFFLKLRALSKEDCDFAKAVMFYGVAMALFEWRDRQRSIPYDPDVHGPITFSVCPPKNPSR